MRLLPRISSRTKISQFAPRQVSWEWSLLDVVKLSVEPIAGTIYRRVLSNHLKAEIMWGRFRPYYPHRGCGKRPPNTLLRKLPRVKVMLLGIVSPYQRCSFLSVKEFQTSFKTGLLHILFSPSYAR